MGGVVFPSQPENAGHWPAAEGPELLVRRFDFALTMIYGPAGPTGVQVTLTGPGIRKVSFLFDRSQFVNLATAGLHALDLADRANAEHTERG